MFRRSLVIALAAFVLTAGTSSAQAPLATATGVVEKATKDSLTIQPRLADGTFGKSLVLKGAGTSNIFTVATRMQGKKTIASQKEGKITDLKPKQPVSVIYLKAKEGNILLCAVVQPGR
jgi:hypothetical protein